MSLPFLTGGIRVSKYPEKKKEITVIDTGGFLLLI
jgi:hypothetical protein